MDMQPVIIYSQPATANSVELLVREFVGMPEL